MATDRDLEILRFINYCGIVTTAQIKESFFSETSKTVMSRRLNCLIDYGYINRIRLRAFIEATRGENNGIVPNGLSLQLVRRDLVDLAESSYLYYVDTLPSIKMLVHELIGSSVILSLKNLGLNITDVTRNTKYKGVIPDITVQLANGKVLLIEIQNVTNPVDNCTTKYRNFDLDDNELLILVSKNETVQSKELNFIWVDIYSRDVSFLKDLIKSDKVPDVVEPTTFNPKNKKICLRSNITGELFEFESLVDASKFLGKPSNYLASKLKLFGEFSIETYC